MSRMPYIPPQETFFYNGPWTRLEDEFFIEELIEQKRQGKWRNDDHVNFTALVNDIHGLNKRLNITFTWQDGFERKYKLYDRYTTFKEMLNHPKTWWDRDTNVVHTSKEVWLRLMRENELVKAYFHKGEPEWNQLDRLFYTPPIDDPNEPIIIPSDPELEADDQFKQDDDEGNETKDVSPMTKATRGFTPLRLFDDDNDDATDIPCMEPFYSSGKYINLGGSSGGVKDKGKGVGSSCGGMKGKGKKKK